MEATLYLLLLPLLDRSELDLLKFSATKVTSGRGVVGVSGLDGLEMEDVVVTTEEEDGLDVFITNMLWLCTLTVSSFMFETFSENVLIKYKITRG